MLKLVTMAIRQSSAVSTSSVIALDDVELESDTTPRSKTASPTGLRRADSDTTGLQSDQRASTQTEGVFRRFIDEMDSRCRQRVGRQLAETESISDNHSSSSTSFPSSSAAADVGDDDELLS